MAAANTSLRYSPRVKTMPAPKPMPEIKFPKPLKLNPGVPIPENWAGTMTKTGIDLISFPAVF